jgi:alpha-tubulin suppressor-like RCC1 family protein
MASDSKVPVTANNIPSGATSVVVGAAHACAVVGKFIGCWGGNGSGQVGFDSAPATLAIEQPGRAGSIEGTSLTLALGTGFTCAVADGSAFCWGANDEGQLARDATVSQSSTPLAMTALGTGVRSIGANGVEACAVVASGGVSCWGNGNPTPTGVANLANAVEVVVGSLHKCALTSDKGVFCWGDNLYGELGVNGALGGDPVNPTGLPTNVTALSVGGMHTCAIAGSDVWCWGANTSGELGRDLAVTRGLPAVVSGMTGALAVAAGENHTCVLLPQDKLKCWGNNDEGQLGNDTTNGGPTPVDVKWP